MARKFYMPLLVAMALVALLQGSAMATTYTVGDAQGWAVPANGAATYTTWATGKTFTVGDILVFNFTTGVHTVAQVTKAAFDSCTTTSPISISTTGPTKITLDTAGENYFICTITVHCSLGQQLAINVIAPRPSPAPKPSSTPAPASAPKSSTPAPASAPKSSTPSPVSAPPPTPSTATPPPKPTHTTPTPTGSAAVPPPTRASSAPTFSAAAGLSTFFLSIVVALLY